MSNQIDPFSNSLNTETIEKIEKLNLSTIQKQHVRLLAHCHALLKQILIDKSLSSDEKDLLKQWCINQSQKFNDQKFSNLLYEQILLTSRRMHNFSRRVGKDIRDLSIDDFVLLVQESQNSQ